MAAALSASPLPSFVAGLVAAPLAWLEAWGERRERRSVVALLAWALAFAWLSVGYLQWVYVGALYENGAVNAALEQVRLATRELLRSRGGFDELGLGVPFAVCAAVLATPVAIRVSPSQESVVFVPPAAALTMILVLGRSGHAFWTGITFVALAAIPTGLLMLLYVITDASVGRVLGSTSDLDGALDG